MKTTLLAAATVLFGAACATEQSAVTSKGAAWGVPPERTHASMPWSSGAGRAEARRAQLASNAVHAPQNLPPHQLRVGEGARFMVVSTGSAASAAWESSKPRVLQSLGAGMFYARAPGSAMACASFDRTSQCIPVEVLP